MSSKNGFIAKYLDPFLSSFFDGQPIHFKPQHEEGVLPLRKRLSKPHYDILILRKPLCRNSFLCGCLDYTEEEELEHLFVGYGIKKGKGTVIQAFEHHIGEKNRVPISSAIENNIQSYIIKDIRNEVLIFHNHPSIFLNELFDNAPLASADDRSVLQKSKFENPYLLLRTLFSQGTLHFYLAENGFVREVKAPNVLTLIENAMSYFSLASNLRAK